MLHSCSIAAPALEARAPAQAAQALATGQAPASVPAQAPAQAIGANNPCPNYGGAIARMADHPPGMPVSSYAIRQRREREQDGGWEPCPWRSSLILAANEKRGRRHFSPKNCFHRSEVISSPSSPLAEVSLRRKISRSRLSLIAGSCSSFAASAVHSMSTTPCRVFKKPDGRTKYNDLLMLSQPFRISARCCACGLVIWPFNPWKYSTPRLLAPQLEFFTHKPSCPAARSDVCSSPANRRGLPARESTVHHKVQLSRGAARPISSQSKWSRNLGLD